MKRDKVQRYILPLLNSAIIPWMSVFLPHDKKFFEFFEALAGKAVDAAGLLVELSNDYSKLEEVSTRLGILEEEADSIVHAIIEELFFDHTRVTEEKGDIRYFAHNLDNVIDGIEKAVNRLTFTQAPTPPEPVVEFAPL